MRAKTKSDTPLALREAHQRVKTAKHQVKLIKAQLKVARGALKAAKRARDEAELAVRVSTPARPAKRAAIASRKKVVRAKSVKRRAASATKLKPAPAKISVVKVSSPRRAPPKQANVNTSVGSAMTPMAEKSQADALKGKSASAA